MVCSVMSGSMTDRPSVAEEQYFFRLGIEAPFDYCDYLSRSDGFAQFFLPPGKEYCKSSVGILQVVHSGFEPSTCFRELSYPHEFVCQK